MKIAIHQPNFLPHKGFFDKIREADLFVLLDSVEFSNGSYTNRVKVGTKWLTVPVIKKSNQIIKDVEIFQSEKTLRKLRNNLYQNHRESYKVLQDILEQDHKLLSELNTSCIKRICRNLKIQTNIVRSSDFNFKGSKNDLLIQIIKKLGGNTYLTAKSDYIDEQKFRSNGIDLEYFNSMENSNGKSIITQ